MQHAAHTERRWRILPIEGHYIGAMLMGRLRIELRPILPPDAWIVSVQGNWAGQTVDLLVASSTFDPVPVNETPPRWIYGIEIHPVAQESTP